MKPDWQPPETAPLKTEVLVDCDEGICVGRCEEYPDGRRHWYPHPMSRDSDSLYRVKAWAELPEESGFPTPPWGA